MRVPEVRVEAGRMLAGMRFKCGTLGASRGEGNAS